MCPLTPSTPRRRATSSSPRAEAPKRPRLRQVDSATPVRRRMFADDAADHGNLPKQEADSSMRARTVDQVPTDKNEQDNEAIDEGLTIWRHRELVLAVRPQANDRILVLSPRDARFPTAALNQHLLMRGLLETKAENSFLKWVDVHTRSFSDLPTMWRWDKIVCHGLPLLTHTRSFSDLPTMWRWDKIVCHGLPLLTNADTFFAWADGCAKRLQPNGHLILQLVWLESDKNWCDVAWRYVWLSSRKGFMLQSVNGCEATQEKLWEHQLSHVDSERIAIDYTKLAARVGRVSGFRTLQRDLRNAAAGMRYHKTDAEEELIQRGEDLYGVFMPCVPQKWK